MQFGGYYYIYRLVFSIHSLTHTLRRMMMTRVIPLMASLPSLGVVMEELNAEMDNLKTKCVYLLLWRDDPGGQAL